MHEIFIDSLAYLNTASATAFGKYYQKSQCLDRKNEKKKNRKSNKEEKIFLFSPEKKHKVYQNAKHIVYLFFQFLHTLNISFILQKVIHSRSCVLFSLSHFNLFSDKLI